MVMVNLEIDLADVGGRPVTMARAVSLHAPKQRSSAVTQDRVTLTDPVYVDLAAGKGTVAVEPGPLVVQIRGGLADTKPKNVVVPDDGRASITLRELLDATFVYDPPVVTATQQAAVRAEAAALRAEQAAGEGGGEAALTEDPSRPGLYFFSSAAAADGALAAASSYYKSAALASGSTRLKLLTLGDSTNDGFGAPGGPNSWAKVWPQRLAELLRAQLGRPAGGRGWVPPSPPVGLGSYSFNTAQQLPAGRALDALNVPTFQTGIPGSLWLQRGHASNADEVLYTLSAGATAVDVLTTGYSGNMIITASNAGSSITKSSVGDRVITRITNPGATLSIRGDVGVGLAILGIIEHVGDEGAGVTQVNLSQASIRAFEVAGWLTGSDKSTLPLIDAYDPHVALITLGSNDKGTGRTQAEMSSAMTTIVDRLRSAVAQMEIVFIVRPDPDAGWVSYGNNIVATAAALGARSLDLRGQLASSSLYVADGVHFNEAGNSAMDALVLDYMKVGV